MACPKNTDGTRYITHINGVELPSPIEVRPGESMMDVAVASTVGAQTWIVQMEWFEV